MIKMMLKATVSHTALRIGMAAWAYKAAPAPTGWTIIEEASPLDVPPSPSSLS